MQIYGSLMHLEIAFDGCHSDASYIQVCASILSLRPCLNAKPEGVDQSIFLDEVDEVDVFTHINKVRGVLWIHCIKFGHSKKSSNIEYKYDTTCFHRPCT